jgi:hypothetical protein
LVEPEQASHDFVVGERSRTPILSPAVGFRHRLIERGVGIC